MATIREAIKRLNETWLDLSEDHYLHVWAGVITLCVGGIMVFMLFSQTERIDVLKKDNVDLMQQISIANSELTSLKAQIESNSAPVVLQQQRQIDSVIESGTQEIQGKVKEIQDQLINNPTPTVENKPTQPQVKSSTATNTQTLNKSLLDGFCKDNAEHQSCRGAR